MNTKDNAQRLQEIGNKIRAKRAYAGITQDQLADKADMTKQTIFELENGKRPNPGISLLFRIADALGCGIKSLL